MNVPSPTSLELMEVTLRDGSYVVNFQLTANDTALIAAALEAAGFNLIEVGHGIGLGASERGMGQAAETDEGYMRATADALQRSRWGMFCIPGIASLDHVNLAADHGMHFLRIGTNVNEVPESRPFIERAKKHGMFVCSNFMKSYVCTPEEFAEYAKLSADYGSDMVYIVDSAGGMLAEDVRRYTDAVRARTKVKLGFHGHNNLGLGVANALAAVEAGVSIVDTSLQGFGRSAGNTATEQFLCVLLRRGIDLGIDPITVMDIGERFIVPMITARGASSLDTVAGLAQFHSSYMGVIREFSGKYGVDPRRLIIALCEQDKVNAPRELVERLAKELAARKVTSAEPVTARFHLDRYFGSEQR